MKERLLISPSYKKKNKDIDWAMDSHMTTRKDLGIEQKTTNERELRYAIELHRVIMRITTESMKRELFFYGALVLSAFLFGLVIGLS